MFIDCFGDKNLIFLLVIGVVSSYSWLLLLFVFLACFDCWWYYFNCDLFFHYATTLIFVKEVLGDDGEVDKGERVETFPVLNVGGSWRLGWEEGRW